MSYHTGIRRGAMWLAEDEVQNMHILRFYTNKGSGMVEAGWNMTHFCYVEGLGTQESRVGHRDQHIFGLPHFSSKNIQQPRPFLIL